MIQNVKGVSYSIPEKTVGNPVIIKKQVGKDLFYFQPKGNANTKPIIETLINTRAIIKKNIPALSPEAALESKEAIQKITKQIIDLKWLKVLSK